MSKKKDRKIFKRETKKYDYIWKNLVKDRDGRKCQVCGMHPDSPIALQAHHIIPRTIYALRHDVKNGITLCVGHHKWGKFSAHGNGLWFTKWLKEHKPEQYEYLMQRLIEIEPKPEKKEEKETEKVAQEIIAVGEIESKSTAL